MSDESRVDNLTRWFVMACATSAGLIAVFAGVAWATGHAALTALGTGYSPMAPSTAAVFILLSAAQVSLAFRPGHWAPRLFAVASALTACLISLLVAWQYSGMISPSATAWLMPAPATTGGAIVGKMAHLTALTFSVCSIALILPLPAGTRYPWMRQLASLLSTAVSLFGLTNLLGYLIGAPLLYGTRHTPMSLATALDFTLLGWALSVSSSRTHWIAHFLTHSRMKDGNTSIQRARMVWASIGLAILIAIATGSTLFLKKEIATVRARTWEQLDAIAQSKADRISYWYAERMADAQVLASLPIEALSPPSTGIGHLKNWLATVQHNYGCHRLLLLDQQHHVLLSVPAGEAPVDPETSKYIEKAFRSNTIVVHDLHHDPLTRHSQNLDILIPLGGTGDRSPPWVAMQEISATTTLFPLVEDWPLRSRTAEILLVRHEGGSVLYLSNLRHQTDAGLELRFPLNTGEFTDALPFRNRPGVAECIDYRHVPVLAASRLVKGTPWAMVAKIDQEDVYQDVRRQTWMLLLILMGGYLLLYFGLGLLWQRHATTLLQAQLAAEESKRQSDTLINSILENTSAVVFVKDLAGKYLLGNRKYGELFHVTQAGIAGKNDYDIFPADFARKFQDADRQVLEADGPIETEEVAPQDDGIHTYISVKFPIRDAAGKPFAVCGIATDITDRKRTEEALLKSRTDWESIFNAIAQPAMVLDPSHRIIAANRATLKASGRTLEELRTLHCWQIFHGPTAAGPVNSCPMELALHSGTHELGEVEVETFGGTYLVDCTPINNERGEIEGMIHIATDITQFKTLQQDLLQSQKLETVGLLAGGIAHDFNNLLQILFGHTDILLESTTPGDQRHTSAAAIHHIGERAAALTRQLLAYSRRQVLAPTVIDLTALVSGVSCMLSRVIGENVRLSFKPEAGLWRVKVDASQIDQVLINLAINSRDAMPNGGDLIIEAGNIVLPEGDPILRPDGHAGRFVRLTVTDTGMGMPPEIKSRIFEPFFSTKERDKGTGLGLASVYGIIRQHDGRITVASEPGKGTCFTIYLPAVVDESKAQAPRPVVHASGGHNERILVVEDEALVRRLIAQMLTRGGYRVTAVETCAEAEALDVRLFDLVFSDVVLPDGNGVDLVQSLKEKRPELRCVLTSGYADVHSRRPELANWPFLVKPFSNAQLLTSVAEALVNG